MKKIAQTLSDSSLDCEQTDDVVSALVAGICVVIRHPAIRAAFREALAIPATPIEPVSIGGLASLDEAARFFKVSKATVGRWLLEKDAPFEQVGTRRKIDLVVFREWLRARGKKASKARPEGAPDPIDVSGIAARAGLRIAGRGRP